MKCPVCDKENKSMLCPNCGFDSSRDYERCPTFVPVKDVPPISILRKQWQEEQKPVESPTPAEPMKEAKPEPVESTPVDPELPVQSPKKRKFLPLVIAAVCALTLGLGIWIGVGLAGGGSSSSEWRANVLKADDLNSYNVYGTDILRHSVKKITFLDSLNGAPSEAVDVSENGDGSVKLWWEEDDGEYNLFYAADGGINGKYACGTLFQSYVVLKTIDFNDSFHTDESVSMYRMFYNCSSLNNLDLSSFNTFNVKTMEEMFSECISLTKLDLKFLDTSNVEIMTNMFQNCPAGDAWQHLLD